VPGAILGWLAMITPCFTVIPLIRYLGRRAEHPRFRSMLEAATLASAGLILASIEPLAHDAVTGWPTFALAVGAFLMLVATKVETIWIIAAAVAIGALSAVVA
jgi:chromate transporter